MEDNRGNILEASIRDTLPVLVDLGLMDKEELGRDACIYDHVTASSSSPFAWSSDWISQLREAIQLNLESANASLPLGIPNARARWLKRENERMIVETYARELAKAFSIHELGKANATKTFTLIRQLFAHPENNLLVLTIIVAVRKATETYARMDDKGKARSLKRMFAPFLWNASNMDSPDIRDAFVITMYHWHALGICDYAELQANGIPLPRLDVSFSTVRAEIDDEIREILPIVDSLQADPACAELLYPVIILFGSRIKGYGAQSADLDVAVFVKPDTAIEERPRLQHALKHILAAKRIGGKALEFWLASDREALTIRDFPNPDNALGDSTLAHVLFEGIWCGDSASIKELHEKLLTGYLYSKGKTVLGRAARSVWLEEMERDTLQYRLMHKGYARFFPKLGGIGTAPSDHIDSKSMFWDSGYRRLATKLFVTKVYLPQLEP